MSECLLDVNVLIALLWPPHAAHLRTQRWFSQHARHGWSTCAMTEAGFVRVASNPVFSQTPISPSDAISVLQALLKQPGHRFWKDSIAFANATAPLQDRLRGHKQVTDAYLLGLTLHYKGRLVTCDQSISALLPENVSGQTIIAL